MVFLREAPVRGGDLLPRRARRQAEHDVRVGLVEVSAGADAPLEQGLVRVVRRERTRPLLLVRPPLAPVRHPAGLERVPRRPPRVLLVGEPDRFVLLARPGTCPTLGLPRLACGGRLAPAPAPGAERHDLHARLRACASVSMQAARSPTGSRRTAGSSRFPRRRPIRPAPSPVRSTGSASEPPRPSTCWRTARPSRRTRC